MIMIFHLIFDNYRKFLIRSRASIKFHEIFAQNLLSKIKALLRVVFEGGLYLRAGSIGGFTVCKRFLYVNVVMNQGFTK